MADGSRFDRKALVLHIAVAATVGGAIAFFTDAKWLAASFWVSAAMFINGSIATVEDARPGGFNNPDGTDTPDLAKGRGATKYALSSLASFVALVLAGFVAQTQL